MLVQELYRIQNRLGWLPEGELRALAARCRVPLYRLEEVSSFFPHFRRQPPPEIEVKVCRDMSCHLRGAEQVLSKLQSVADVQNQAAARSGGAKLSVAGCSCLGRCDRAVAMTVEFNRAGNNGHHGNGSASVDAKHSSHHSLLYCHQTPQSAAAIVERAISGHAPADQQDSTFPRHSKEPWQIDVYADRPAGERYEAIRWYLAESGQASAGAEPVAPRSEDERAKEVLAALETAGLLGMGGAGGRTYKKWQEVREAKVTPKYVVCNGDESEPGTFKDREILLRAPHLVVEGVILGGLVVGASRGIIYIRHEFEEQIEAVRRAIAEAEQLEVCGANILGSGRSFPVEVFVSPGGYICGEQTALIEAIEDKRAEPRNRPPELQTNGLYDKPTLLNNVETLAWVPAVVLRIKDEKRGQWFADQGIAPFKGRRFFS